MSKHDTILKNLCAVTRCRSSSAAMRGWEVGDKIALSDRVEPAACELCGTRFRRGAVVTRPMPRATKPITLTVGGDCLVTLLEGQFRDPMELAKRRVATTTRIGDRYEGLVDAGSWVSWVYENAPRDLAHAAVRLKHLGAVRSNAELKALVAFHDGKRRYPAEAVLPMADDLRACGIRVPESITLDRARRLMAGLSDARLGRVLGRIGQAYLDACRPGRVYGWDGAWRSCTPLQHRLIAALAWLSEAVQNDGADVWKGWLKKHVRLPHVTGRLSPPQFVWNEAYGLCLVSEDAGDPDSTVDVFLWGRNDWSRFRVTALRSLVAVEGHAVLALEREAFWDVPQWCKPG